MGMDKLHGQAGEIEISPAMIDAGVGAYEQWESEHIFDELGGAGLYAARELVISVYRAMAICTGPERLGKPRSLPRPDK
jgi:hypothetical protein